MQGRCRAVSAIAGRPGQMCRQSIDLEYDTWTKRWLPMKGGPFLYARIFSRLYNRKIMVCTKNIRADRNIRCDLWGIKYEVKIEVERDNDVCIYSECVHVHTAINPHECPNIVMEWLTPEFRMEVGREQNRVLSGVETLAAAGTDTSDYKTSDESPDVDYF